MFSSIKSKMLLKLKKALSHISAKEELRNFNTFLIQPNISLPHTINFKNYHVFKGKGNAFGVIAIGENFSFRDYCNILVYPDSTLNIGNNVFMNNYCSINCLDSIIIGDNTMFGENVRLFDHNHIIEKDETLRVSKENFSTAPIVIGKNCWLASNVIVLKGATIGDNCIIGANCIIHKSIPDNTIVKNNQNLIFETL